MLAPNTVLRGRYTVVRQLGEGAQGAVYLATDGHFDNSPVAIKEALSGVPGLVEAFKTEALLLRRLRHRALPGVIDCFADDGAWFLVMDFIPGDPFSKLIPANAGPFAVELVLEWADQLLGALDYLHTRSPSIIHRDVKPANIVLMPEGQVVLLDFGGSREYEAERSRILGVHSVTFYSSHFSPLEAKRPGGADPRSDIYSIAATIYGMLTQQLPEDAVTRAVTVLRNEDDPLIPADAINPLVPRLVSQILVEGMALQKEVRIGSAAIMRSMLRAARADLRPAGSSAVLAVGSMASVSQPVAVESPEVEKTRTPTWSTEGVPLLEPVRNSVGMDLILMRSGTFAMGSASGEPDERPVHPVIISSPFLIGRYPVTQSQWVDVMGDNPSKFPGDARPVEEVSWDDCQEFLRKLNDREGGSRYRLPTEAEWEYACRAGSTGEYAGDLAEMAWFGENASGMTHPVGLKAPNAWGLFDMYGNVWEWCHDWYGGDYYAKCPDVDPAGPNSGTAHVFRGGGWRTIAWRCRSAYRRNRAPAARFGSLGFRVVRIIG